MHVLAVVFKASYSTTCGQTNLFRGCGAEISNWAPIIEPSSVKPKDLNVPPGGC